MFPERYHGQGPSDVMLQLLTSIVHCRARPMSATRAWLPASMKTLLGLRSLCRMGGLDSSMACMPRATPISICNRSSIVRLGANLQAQARQALSTSEHELDSSMACMPRATPISICNRSSIVRLGANLQAQARQALSTSEHELDSSMACMPRATPISICNRSSIVRLGANLQAQARQALSTSEHGQVDPSLYKGTGDRQIYRSTARRSIPPSTVLTRST